MGVIMLFNKIINKFCKIANNFRGFYPEGYLFLYPDARSSGMSPWEHYMKIGLKEGRTKGFPREWDFDEIHYRHLYRDVAKAGVDPWRHYVEHGFWEGRLNGVDAAPRFAGKAAEDTLGATQKQKVLAACGAYLRSFGERRNEIRRHAARQGSGDFQGRRIAIFTAVTGGFEHVKLPFHIEDAVDYICFTDAPLRDTGLWSIRPCPYFDEDPRRMARYIKTHPHHLLKEYDIVIWFDCNVIISCDILKYIKSFLDSSKYFASVRHPYRDTIIEEAHKCREIGKDTHKILVQQISQYDNHMINDLIETNFYIADIGKEEVRNFFQIWWHEIDNNSKRDQISVNYSLQKAGLDWLPLLDSRDSLRVAEGFALAPHSITVGYPETGHTLIDPYRNGAYADVVEGRIQKFASMPIDIVICIHNALDDVKNCLASLLRHKCGNERLLLVDDGSDEETAQYLKKFCEGRMDALLLRNEKAVHCSRAANMGLEASTAPFVILLNSDTIVTRGWAQKMADALFSTEGAGIVGPMSNAASSQSLPDINPNEGNGTINALPQDYSADEANAFCEHLASMDFVPRVSLVHGFCLGVRRECLEKLGGFDVKHFPRGLGKEDDFCLRAVDAGYALCLAVHTYVYHAKSKSYPTPKRIALRKQSIEQLHRLHGRERVRSYVRNLAANPTLQFFRKNFDALYTCLQHARPTVVLCPELGDGTALTREAHRRLLGPWLSDALSPHADVRIWKNGALPPTPHGEKICVFQGLCNGVDKRSFQDWADKLRDAGGKIIYDVDERWLAPSMYAEYSGCSLSIANDLFERVKFFCTIADAVTVPNATMRGIFQEFQRKCFIVRNHLDMAFLIENSTQVCSAKVDIIVYKNCTSLAAFDDAGYVFGRLKERFGGQISIHIIGYHMDNPVEYIDTSLSHADLLTAIEKLKRHTTIAVLQCFDPQREMMDAEIRESAAVQAAVVLPEQCELSDFALEDGKSCVMVRNAHNDLYDKLCSLITNKNFCSRIADNLCNIFFSEKTCIHCDDDHIRLIKNLIDRAK